MHSKRFEKKYEKYRESVTRSLGEQSAARGDMTRKAEEKQEEREEDDKRKVRRVRRVR